MLQGQTFLGATEFFSGHLLLDIDEKCGNVWKKIAWSNRTPEVWGGRLYWLEEWNRMGPQAGSLPHSMALRARPCHWTALTSGFPKDMVWLLGVSQKFHAVLGRSWVGIWRPSCEVLWLLGYLWTSICLRVLTYKMLREVLRCFCSWSVDSRVNSHTRIIHKVQTPWQFSFTGSQHVTPMLVEKLCFEYGSYFLQVLCSKGSFLGWWFSMSVLNQLFALADSVAWGMYIHRALLPQAV